MNHSNEYLVNMVSTLPDGKCGIGIHTDYIINELKNQNIIVRLVPLELNCNNAIYYLKKAFESTRRCNIVHVQFEYHLFGEKLKMIGIYSLLFFPLLKVVSYFKGFKIVTTMHEIYEPIRIKDIIVDLIKKPNKKKLYALYALLRHNIIVNTSDRIIVLSELNKNKIVQTGVNPKKIGLIPLGTDVPKFLDKKQCKKGLRIHPDKKVITIFGMISQHKGHDIFIDVANKFNSDVCFLIAGEAKSERDRNYFEILKRNTPKNAVFYGFVSQEKIPTLLNAIDIMVLPYRSTSVSGVLELSMSYQIPTITSNLPSFNKIKEQYDCIELFEIDNIESLEKAIVKLLEDKMLRKRLTKNAHMYFNENSIIKVARQTLQIYSEIL